MSVVIAILATLGIVFTVIGGIFGMWADEKPSAPRWATAAAIGLIGVGSLFVVIAWVVGLAFL